jgi:AraC family transcriptional regulator, transcriptional activator of pobA
MKLRTVDNFYKNIQAISNGEPVLEDLYENQPDIGHFNVFDITALYASYKERNKIVMPYNRRAYYKISLIKGHNIAEFADKTFDIKQQALSFATPKIPYHWYPQSLDQAGHFCIFSDDFFVPGPSRLHIDQLPIFAPGAQPVFQLSDEQANEIEQVFQKMHKELASGYVYKYDLLRNYVLELIHYGQKLQPLEMLTPDKQNATSRVSSLFIELLERQFPIQTVQERIDLRTAKDFADRLFIHVNYLNRALKETTGKTTSEIIASRLVQEAKLLLQQTSWSISEISYCLGYEEVAHFSNFFRKQTSISPNTYRGH